MDPDEVGPVKGAIAVTMSAAILAFAIVLAPLPALIASLAGGGTALLLIRRSPSMTWEEWHAAGANPSYAAIVLGPLFGAACFVVAAVAEPLAIKAVAIALAGSVCLVYAGNGTRLMLAYRRRRRALRP